MVVKLNISNLK